MRRIATAVTVLMSLGACTEGSGGGNNFGGGGPDGPADGGTSTSGDDGDGDGGDDGTGNDTGGAGTSGDDGATEGDDGGNFIQEPDGGALNECDVWSQDCPAGEKCMPWASDGGNAWNALRCSPIDPSPQSVGDGCTADGGGLSGVDNCELGAMCWNIDSETGLGVCIAICSGTPNSPACDDPATSCSIAHDGVLPLCLTNCDPVLQDCAIENESCVLTADGGFRCEPNYAGTTGNWGDACEYTNVCQPGLFCVAGELVGGCTHPYCCGEFCDLTDPNAGSGCSGIPDGNQCVPWFEAGPAPPGLEHVGFCGLPP